MDTGYVDLRAKDAGVATGPGLRARVHAGRVGAVTGTPAERFAKPFTLIDAELEDGGELLPDVPVNHAAIVYVIDGEVETGGRTVGPAQAAWFAADGDGHVDIRATKTSHVVVYASEPIREQVVAGGPFVMSTEEEIEEAFVDYRAGRFGAIPT